MDRKIELIQDEVTGHWHWVILEYSNIYKSWHNVDCGIEYSFVKACSVARTAYEKKGN